MSITVSTQTDPHFACWAKPIQLAGRTAWRIWPLGLSAVTRLTHPVITWFAQSNEIAVHARPRTTSACAVSIQAGRTLSERARGSGQP